MAQQTKIYSVVEVARHQADGDAWLIIGNKVYDVSKFAALHPAGKKVLLQYAGKDATQVFKYFHAPSVLTKYDEKLCIGRIENAPEKDEDNTHLVPYAEVSTNTPFHTEKHQRLRAAIREWARKNVEPFAEKWDEEGSVPREVIRKGAEQGFLALAIGQPWPEKYYPEKRVCGVEIDKTDTFCEAILYEELTRWGSGGIFWAMVVGTCIGLPPVYKFGSDDLRARIVPQCIRGEKIICLAVTEPWAGSDVANLKTTAVKSPCGKFYTVNGMKKWITNGIFADYFTTAVRTGGEGHSGLSFLVIPADLPGVQRRKMKCQGMWSSGTTFISFDNVRVPAEYLVGKEGEAFKYIMINFNHERIMLTVQVLRMARSCLEEAMKYAHKRKTFGKKLIEHPVIRQKLAHMARNVEATQALVDQVIYNFDAMPLKQNVAQLSGAIALCKAQATQTAEYCAREAIQIFGGLGYTRTGQGRIVEQIYRDIKPITIGGGSEEIMLDLGARNASKLMPKL